ncbi:uncharacterized protein LOC116301420 [Actinia tenebrosa]|uniref:Uncharacterized protein LOC116301420 n=1 Tax=Actinia tenebrosa TaxID=6105 RepID=A0A6P8IHN5_ACTTE|nr:uncharacterized protein LOC116301420 [Actinia tenebrosa]
MSSFIISWLVLLATCLTFVDSRDNFGLGQWSAWGPCKTNGPCGTGTRTKSRCFWFYGRCIISRRKRACYVPCTQDSWSTWGSWTKCSAPCEGTQLRTRTCTNYPRGNCLGNDRETRQCGARKCTTTPPLVHGGWSEWSKWGECSVTCGGGRQSRTRTCTNPAPANGGRNCEGLSSETRICAVQTCPTPPPKIHGQWTTWGSWGACSARCGGGSQSRTRTCTNPAPANGGRNCVGNSSETQKCAQTTCPPGCQVGQTVTDSCSQRCVCGAGGTLTQCTRIRKEFTSMTTAERERYIRVVKEASTNSKYKPRYDTLITLHRNIFFNNGIHDKQHFLTWHRWYILTYENLLREVDCNFTVAYWDWSMVSGSPWSTSASNVWYGGDSGFGGDGTTSDNCVTTGPFRLGVWELPHSVSPPRCLKRRFDGIPPDSVAVTQLIDFPVSRFHDFESTLRLNLHDTVHCLIGGTMCTTDSSSAPEFFLHHGMVDKIWADWQKKSNAHQTAFFASVNQALPGTSGLLPSQFLDNNALPGGVRVEWQDVGNTPAARVVGRLRALAPRMLKQIPRERFSSMSKAAMKLFKVSAEEAAQAEKMDKEIQPEIVSPKSKASRMDKKLGFDHKVLDSMYSLAEDRRSRDRDQLTSSLHYLGKKAQTRMSSFIISWLALLATCLTFVHSLEPDGQWGSWSVCLPLKEPCGVGKRVRTRCYWFYGKCYKLRQSKKCKVPCDVTDGQWSTWGSWSSCSAVPCGGGSQSRTRTCTNPAPANGGSNCDGPSSETQACMVPCPPPLPGWSDWASWSSCSATCGGGSQSRTRTCTNPPPANDGRSCEGTSSETKSCATNTCPPPKIDGGWSDWTSWSSCPVTCGGGSQSRTRTCTNPPPANGGADCQGNSRQTRYCATNTCQPGGCQAGQTVTDSCGQRCVCGAGGTLTQCTRIRKEFTAMTTDERERYIRVVKTVSTDARYKSRYDTLITLHKTIFFNNRIHEQQHFLTWHRWYILTYENLLREVDCRVTVPYWDWSVVSGSPWGTSASDVWYAGDSGMGGDGTTRENCVTTGPFRLGVWELVPSAPRPRCLKRSFFGNPPDSAAVADLVKLPASRFEDFEVTLRVNLHDTVHCLIGETMCTTDAASAPEFFLHHGMVDKIWTDWQKNSNSHRTVFFPSVNEELPGTDGRLPSQFVDNAALPGGVRVEYLPISGSVAADVVNRLRALSPEQIKMIPRERFSSIDSRAINLFKVSAEDQARAKKMDSEIQPEQEMIPPSEASVVDKKLGFDHNVVVK